MLPKNSSQSLPSEGTYFNQVDLSYVIKKQEPIYSMLSIILYMNSAPFAGRRFRGDPGFVLGGGTPQRNDVTDR